MNSGQEENGRWYNEILDLIEIERNRIASNTSGRLRWPGKIASDYNVMKLLGPSTSLIGGVRCLNLAYRGKRACELALLYSLLPLPSAVPCSFLAPSHLRHSSSRRLCLFLMISFLRHSKDAAVIVA